MLKSTSGLHAPETHQHGRPCLERGLVFLSRRVKTRDNLNVVVSHQSDKGCEGCGCSRNMEDPHDVVTNFRLTNEQSTLYRVLHRRSERIAQMYLGAIIAMNHGQDPERWCKAAHELRELMMNMSEVADVEIRALNESLGKKVAELETAFDSVVENSKLKPPKWDGPADQPVQHWLNKSTEFFNWKRNHQPRRRAEFTKVLRALDGPNRLLPAEIEERNVESWMDTKSYFDKIAHHGSNAVEREFLERMAYVESVLHNKLNPRTFGNFDALDEIIEEGERR
jgi:hypothetical protein